MGYIFSTHKFAFFFAMFMVLVSSLFHVIGNLLLQPLVDKYITPNIGVTNPNLAPMFRLLMYLAIIYFVAAFAQYLYLKLMIRITQDVLFKIRDELFERVQNLRISDLDKKSSGNLMSLFTNDIESLRMFLSDTIPSFLSSSIILIGLIIGMFILSWVLTIISFLSLGGMLLIVTTVSKRSAKFFKGQQSDLANVNSFAEEMIQGQKVVKVFSHENEIKRKFNVLNTNLQTTATKAYMYTNIVQPITTNLGYVNYIIIALAGSWLMLDSRVNGFSMVTLGVLLTFIQFAKTISQPVMQFSSQLYTINTASAGAGRIFDVIDMDIEDIEQLNSKYQIVQENNRLQYKYFENGEVKYKEFNGDVEFRDVRFSYEEGREILKGISFKVKNGEKVAFVGSTGAGKTTIISLVNRFYDVDSGEILLDGINIKDIKLKDLRGAMAYVLQETNLFTGTIKENIKYGKLDASDEDVVTAACISNADSFIRYLEKGYDTKIKAMSGKLSQGQRQLASIARAAISDRAILFLDEATSSVDTRTEQLIQQGLSNLMKNYTVFIIAHRLSTVKNVDNIIVLDHGNIIEQGKHQELIDKKGVYYELYTGNKELD